MLPFPDTVDPAPLLYPLLAVRCRLLLRDCEPALIEEMRGVADGAGVSFDEIVFLNTWVAVADQTDPTELFRLKPGCATAAAGTLLAHNTDWPPGKDFPDVAALVTRLTADEVDVTLVNINQVSPRSLIVQGGAYGEHTITSVRVNGQETKVGDRLVAVDLAPGSGANRFASLPAEMPRGSPSGSPWGPSRISGAPRCRSRLFGLPHAPVLRSVGPADGS